MRVRALAGRLAGWLGQWEEIRPDDPFLVRCVRGLLSVDARDRVLVLAGQAFIALIPMFLVFATFTSSADGEAVADHLVSRFHLAGDAAGAVTGLFARPPGGTNGITLVSLLMLLMSVNSYSRSMRRTFERAWDLPHLGMAGFADGLLATLTLVVMAGTLSWVGGWLNDPGAARWLGAAVFVAIAVPGWLVTLSRVLCRRVGRRALVPGAAYATAVSLVASWSAAIWFPRIITHDAARYGVIGVSFALVTWLIVYAAVLVSVAYVSAEAARSLGRHPAGSTPG